MDIVNAPFFGKKIGIELTRFCNFDCVHCYLHKNESSLSLNKIDDIISFSNKNGITHMYLTGGEPLLHNQFNKIYLQIRKAGFFVSIYSNGSVLRKSTQSIFKRFPPHLFEISMYGFSERAYEVTTKKGELKKTINTVALLQSFGVNLSLRYILLSTNYKDVDSFAEYAKANSVDATIGAQIVPCRNGDLKPLEYRLPPEVLAPICTRLKLGLYPSKKEFCNAGSDLYICTDGTILGCPGLEMGNEPTISDSHTHIIHYFEQMHALYGRHPCSYGECPAWNKLESLESRKTYISQLIKVSHETYV